MRNKPGGLCIIISADEPYHYLIGKETTSIRLTLYNGRWFWEIDELHRMTGVRLCAPDHALLPIDLPEDSELRNEEVYHDTKEKVK